MVGAGQQYNWTIQRTWFPHFVASADFQHVLGYLDRAAWAVGATETACWPGRVGDVLTELTTCQERLGRPPPEEELAADDARRVLAEVVGYVRSNRGRMDYPPDRRQGLPVPSSWAESLVGEFASRVKGRDKYCHRGAGAEAIRQVRAAVLSQAERRARYVAERPGHPYRRREHAE